MNSEFRQDRIDPLLAAAYAELKDESPPEVDWEGLRQSIIGSATPILLRRRFRRVMISSRPLVPLAVAASLAFGLLIGPPYLREMLTPETTVTAASIDADAIISHAINAELSDEEFQDLVTGRANPEALLASVVVGR